MGCENPIRAYLAGNGQVRMFKRTDPQYWIEPYNGMHVPCGTCILCREEQARQQTVRITHEATLHEANSFLTLTYSDDKIPEHNSLDYTDLQKFWKRLRKAEYQLRYYAVGEYGDNTLRPHYHACVFGQDFTTDRIIVKTTPHLLWTSPTLNAAWGLGHVTVGALTPETAAYTAQYVTKKLRSKQKYVRVDETTGELIAIEQPRAFMSKNLAKDWWNQWKKGVIELDRVIMKQRPAKPPKAYDRWLSEIDKEAIQRIKTKRTEKRKQQNKEENRARARNARAHAEQRKRRKIV